MCLRVLPLAADEQQGNRNAEYAAWLRGEEKHQFEQLPVLAGPYDRYRSERDAAPTHQSE